MDQHRQANRQIAIWLFALAGLVVLMVLVGGLTRLTDSGLSITEWAPIRGALPPLGQADWLVAFGKYKQIPEYQRINAGMSLSAFKYIYWWEWGHRQLGRFIGLVFLIPLVIFLLQGKIARDRLLALLGLFLLGCLQGFTGWYMVSSGLGERVDVSQYRLAIHLGLALIIFGFSLWLALGYWRDVRVQPQTGTLVATAGAIVALVFIQSLLGALVAGIDAGAIYNDWPLMDGDFLPAGLLAQSPLVRNFFENHLTVQFNHRMLAYFLILLIGWHIVRVWHAQSTALIRGTAQIRGTALIRHSIMWLGGGVLGQVMLGIVALIWVVPMPLAVAHQIGAVALLALALLHLHFLRYSR